MLLNVLMCAIEEHLCNYSCSERNCQHTEYSIRINKLILLIMIMSESYVN